MDLCSPPIPSDIARLTGPLFLGFIFNWGLFGVSSVQVYIYHTEYPNDRALLKSVVYGVYFIEALQTLVFTSSGWHSLVAGFGHLEALDQIQVGWWSVPIISGIVTFIAQSFYAYRITILAQSKVIACVIMLLTFIQLGGALGTAVVVKRSVLFSRLLGKASYLTAGFWEAGSALCDVVIAVCMTYYLRTRDAGVKQTHKILTQLIRLIIGTGTLTAAIAILTLALTYLPSRPTYYQASSAVLGKVYSNAMMVVLNSRKRSGRMEDSEVGNTALTRAHSGINRGSEDGDAIGARRGSSAFRFNLSLNLGSGGTATTRTTRTTGTVGTSTNGALGYRTDDVDMRSVPTSRPWGVTGPSIVGNTDLETGLRETPSPVLISAKQRVQGKPITRNNSI